MAAMSSAVRGSSYLKRSVPSCRGFATEITFKYTSNLPAGVLKDLKGADWVKVDGKSPVSGKSASFSAVVSVKAFSEANRKLGGLDNPNAHSHNDRGLVNIPESRVLYTVLRSPFIDKKSREQFEMKVKKQNYIIKAETPQELRRKLFWLKRTAR